MGPKNRTVQVCRDNFNAHFDKSRIACGTYIKNVFCVANDISEDFIVERVRELLAETGVKQMAATQQIHLVMPNIPASYNIFRKLDEIVAGLSLRIAERTVKSRAGAAHYARGHRAIPTGNDIIEYLCVNLTV